MRYFFVLFVSMGLLIGKHVNAQDVSLRDKIGQMLIIGFEGKTIHSDSSVVNAIENNNIGGVILFDYNSQTHLFDKNIETPQQVKQLNIDLQEKNQTISLKHNRPSLPLLIAIDYEGGKVNRLKETYGFPATVAAADVGKMSLVAANQVASDMAFTLHDMGFNLNFAPVLDVNVNPMNPIIGQLNRSFSDNPGDVANFAEIYSQQYLRHGVQCAYKHFPGHGSSNADSHQGFVDVTETWQHYELEPYQQLLNGGNACGMVMTAHIVNRNLDESGLPATLSHKMLTGILREQLKFDGVIITDDMQMKAISEHYGLKQALTLAINAGIDMFIFGNQLSDIPDTPENIINIIESQVKSGQINKDRITEAYRRIVTLKQHLQ